MRDRSEDRPLQRPFLNLALCRDGDCGKSSGAFRSIAKGATGRKGQGIAGMPRCVIAYWTIRVNLVVAVWLPDVAVTVTV